jgi:hypothetical protein
MVSQHLVNEADCTRHGGSCMEVQLYMVEIRKSRLWNEMVTYKAVSSYFQYLLTWMCWVGGIASIAALNLHIVGFYQDYLSLAAQMFFALKFPNPFLTFPEKSRFERE